MKPSGPRDDHGADRVACPGCGCCRRPRCASAACGRPSVVTMRLQQPALRSRCRRACGRAPRAHWSAHARSAPSSRRAGARETSTLKPALTDKRVGQQRAFLDLVREQNQLRRRLVVVELREERAQHFFRRERAFRRAGNRRGCPSSARCGRRTPRRRNSRPPDGWRTRRLPPRCAD